MYLTLRTGCERHGRKNPLPLPFSKRSHIGNLRRIRKQGKGRSSKRKENRRLSFLFAPAAGAATSPPSADGESPAEIQRKTSRPLGANTLTQFVCPGQPVQKKEPPRQGEPACGSSRTPLGRCRKSGKSRKNFPTRKGSKNAHSHAEKTSIQTVQLAKPNRPEFSRKFLSKKCLTYWLGYANLYTWLAEAY